MIGYIAYRELFKKRPANGGFFEALFYILAATLIFGVWLIQCVLAVVVWIITNLVKEGGWIRHGSGHERDH